MSCLIVYVNKVFVMLKPQRTCMVNVFGKIPKRPLYVILPFWLPWENPVVGTLLYGNCTRMSVARKLSQIELAISYATATCKMIKPFFLLSYPTITAFKAVYSRLFYTRKAVRYKVHDNLNTFKRKLGPPKSKCSFNPSSLTWNLKILLRSANEPSVLVSCSITAGFGRGCNFRSG